MSILTLALAAVLASAGPSSAPPSPAETFVEILGSQLRLSEEACPEAVMAIPGQPRCGRFARGAPQPEAERVAIRFAEGGGKVLDLEFGDDVPPHLLAQFPGLQPTTPVTGFRRFAYLIGQQRICFWVETDSRLPASAAQPRWLAWIIEPLAGPFPDYMPADGRRSPRPSPN